MHLKNEGSYIARQLSYNGVEFEVVKVDLLPSFIRMYNAATTLVSTKPNYITVYDKYSISTIC